MNKLQHYETTLHRPTGLLLRAFVDRDFDDREPMFRVYTDDGQGNGGHIMTIEWRQMRKLQTKVERTRLERHLEHGIESAI